MYKNEGRIYIFFISNKGKNGGTENEVKAVERAIGQHKGEWDAFITMHAYGQYWFTPYGHSKTVPVDYNDLYAKAKIGADALYGVNKAKFKIGSSARLLCKL